MKSAVRDVDEATEQEVRVRDHKREREGASFDRTVVVRAPGVDERATARAATLQHPTLAQHAKVSSLSPQHRAPHRCELLRQPILSLE